MKLGLGTAQFGLSYGISNRIGQTPKEEADRILDVASENGIDLVDTAFAYGESEAVLGEIASSKAGFRLVTKTLPIRKERLVSDDIDRIKDAFFASLKKLRKENIYGLLVHDACDLLVPGGAALASLLGDLRRQGYVEKIGASIYDGAQIDRITAIVKPDIFQVPLNILDQRLLESGHLSKLKLMNIEVHARSIFLQGLLLMPTNDIPQSLQRARPLLEALHNDLAIHGLTSTQAAMMFVKRTKEVDHIIVGVNSAAQLEENIEAYQSDVQEWFDFSPFSCSDESVVNPSKWKLQ